MSILGKRKSGPNDPWISDITRHSIEQKRQIRKEFGSSSIEYRLSKNNIKKMCKFDKEKEIDNEHKALSDLPFSQQYFAAIKKLRLKQTRHVKGWEMKTPTGKTLTTTDDILENWVQFYEKLYHSDRASFTPFAIDADDAIPPILRSTDILNLRMNA